MRNGQTHAGMRERGATDARSGAAGEERPAVRRGSSPAVAAAPAAGTLRFLGPGDPDHVHPASAYYVRPGQLLRLLNRQLFAFPATGEAADPAAAFTPVPDVAEHVPTVANGGLSPDRRTCTLRLRPGVCWDTTPPREVTAGDFVRGLQRVALPAASGVRAYFAATLQGMAGYCEAFDRAFGGGEPTPAQLARFEAANPISGVRAVDDRTLVLTLCRPANDLLHLLALGAASAVPPAEEAEGRPHPSCGPYRVARRRARGGAAVLERNPAWRPETDPVRRAPAARIVLGAPAAPDAALPVIRSGRAHPAWAFGVVSWNAVDPGDFPRCYPGFTLNPYLVFNLHSPNQGGATGRPQVRRAVALAVDRVEIARIFNALEGVWTAPLHSVIPPGSVGHRAEFDPWPTPGDRGDPARARALLAQAGYPDGLTLRAAVRDMALHREVMDAVAASLARAGIRLRVELHDPARYYGGLLGDPEQARAGAWDLAEPGWTPDWFGNNGRAVLQPLFATDPRPGTTNFGGWSDPAVDRLMDEALAEGDPARADALWHQVDARVMADLPVVPLLAFACRCCAARTGSGWGTAARPPEPWLDGGGR